MNTRVKFTTYLAGGIEHASDKEMGEWRKEIAQALHSPDLLIYDPVEQEAIKTGKEPGEHNKYIKGLKQAGKYDFFFDEMWKVWFGKISQNSDLIQLLINLRMRKFIDGNRKEEISAWGDAEAVVRSDFICLYMPVDLKTVGTIWEEVFAMLFRIPIYLILPDASKRDANSTLLFGNQIANNKNLITFYNLNDCIKYIKETYKL